MTASNGNGKAPGKYYRKGLTLVEAIQQFGNYGAANEKVPEPLAERRYNGKFMVGVPPETHRALVIRAAEGGVSLNRLVNTRLANEPY